MLKILAAIVALALPTVAFAQTPAPEPVEVMILGTYHFGNPGQDLHNARVDPVTTPEKQAQLEAVAEGQQGSHDEVGGDRPGQRKGRGYAGGVQFQRLAGRPAPEDHRGVALDDHREAQLSALSGQGHGQGVGVDLGADGAVDGDDVAGGQVAGVLSRPQRSFRVEAGQTLAVRPHGRPEFVLVGHGGEVAHPQPPPPSFACGFGWSPSPKGEDCAQAASLPLDPSTA